MTALRNDTQDQLTRALGEAVVAMWGRLPSNIQHDLFLEAARSDHLRQQLAVFLHERHPRTSDQPFRGVTEPDSLGG
jgi:hypothetical protein